MCSNWSECQSEAQYEGWQSGPDTIRKQQMIVAKRREETSLWLKIDWQPLVYNEKTDFRLSEATSEGLAREDRGSPVPGRSPVSKKQSGLNTPMRDPGPAALLTLRTSRERLPYTVYVTSTRTTPFFSVDRRRKQASVAYRMPVNY
jgi:hypothetical protein